MDNIEKRGSKMIFFTLKTPDIIFFITLAVIAVLIALVYFLTPIVKRKQFEEARANLKKREETFKANLSKLKHEPATKSLVDTEE